jgi:hypothetical protein
MVTLPLASSGVAKFVSAGSYAPKATSLVPVMLQLLATFAVTLKLPV